MEIEKTPNMNPQLHAAAKNLVDVLVKTAPPGTKFVALVMPPDAGELLTKGMGNLAILSNAGEIAAHRVLLEVAKKIAEDVLEKTFPGSTGGAGLDSMTRAFDLLDKLLQKMAEDADCTPPPRQPYKS